MFVEGGWEGEEGGEGRERREGEIDICNIILITIEKVSKPDNTV